MPLKRAEPNFVSDHAVREASHIVRIEKHRVEGDIAVLTFEEVGVGEDLTPPPPRPLVFVAHGLLSRKERHIELCLDLARAGFLACTLDARHHGERATPEAEACLAGEMNAAFLAAFAEAVVGTVADLGTLSAYFGRDRYGIVGHSMGGFIALKAAVSDPRAQVIVSIAGNPDWAGPAPPSAPLSPQQRAWIERESPLSLADRFWPRPLLLLHGTADEVVPVHGARALHAALRPRYAAGDPSRLALVEYPGVDHAFLPDMAARAVAWMARFLR